MPSGIRGRSPIQKVELPEEDREAFREILRVLHAGERRHVLVWQRKSHGKVRRRHGTVDLVAVLPQARLAAEIEVPSFPEPHFPGVEVDQIVAAAAIFELLRETAGGHPLVVLGEVAEEGEAIFGEFVSRAKPVARQLRSRPEVAAPGRGRSLRGRWRVDLLSSGSGWIPRWLRPPDDSIGSAARCQPRKEEQQRRDAKSDTACAAVP